MQELYQQIQDSIDFLHRRWACSPRVGIILGTGLGSLAEAIDQEAVVSYEEIPHFPCSTATSHQGKLVCGTLCGQSVVTMSGRLHAYEGYSLKQATLPVR